jgi:hypothetical protein
MLVDILTKFGDISGLKTNKCQDIDLDEVLHNFPARRAHFPTKYLGLPLTSTRLWRIDFQPLVDKAMSKLTIRNSKNINPAGIVHPSRSGPHITSYVLPHLPKSS